MLTRSIPAICGALAYLTLCANAPARQWQWQALYTFGDSYTDSGVAGELEREITDEGLSIWAQQRKGIL